MFSISPIEFLLQQSYYILSSPNLDKKCSNFFIDLVAQLYLDFSHIYDKDKEL